MTSLKWAWGWTTWSLFFIPKLVLTVLAFVVATLFIIYGVWKGKEKLPKFLRLWDNDESGYRCCGLGKEGWIGSGDWKERQDYLAKGYNEYQIALHWTLIRNTVNNLQLTFLSSDLRNYDEIVVSETSVKPHHESKTFKEWFSPFPWKVRELMKNTDHGRFYWDKELIRKGWIYYPLLRLVYIHNEKEHTEFLIGFKNYRYKTYFIQNEMYDRPEIINDHLRNSGTVNIAWKRTDDEWA